MIQITSELVTQSLTYANGLVKRRPWSDIDRQFHNNYVGKLGECVAYTYITNSGRRCSLPNFNIFHNRNNARGSVDLISDGLDIEVKTTSTDGSWTFDTRDINITHLIMLVRLNIETLTGQVCGISYGTGNLILTKSINWDGTPKYSATPKYSLESV